MAEPHEDDEHYRPLELVAVVVGALLMFAAFFISFLVAPLAILLIFYVVLSVSDRTRKARSARAAQAPPVDPVIAAEDATDRLAREAAVRRTENRGEAGGPPAEGRSEP